MRHPLLIAAGLVALVVTITTWFLARPSVPAAEAPPTETAAVTTPADTPAATPEPAPPTPRPVTARPTSRTPAPAPVAPAEAAPTTGTLRIETDVPGATVFLDRIGVGDAPLTIPDIATGSHRLNVLATGYDGYAETIDVEPGERTIRVTFKEIRLDARFTAVHKHGMGSCRGVLTGTPQGIQFAAADGQDTFSVAFADIETFEVDYLAKNMRLKVRRGRTYNFGDPDGNADRLFVFHRDVDKVRVRVLADE